jgi:hypothetical protein
MSDNTAVYAGAMPSRQGELALEMHGMAPIPAENRYGSIHRIYAGIRWLETGTLRDAPRAAPVPSAAGSH